MEPFFQFILAESWGCPGMLRMPSGFKAWRLFAHGLQTLSRLLNARALSGSNPQRPFSIIKKGPRWDPSLKLNWRRAGDSNPRCPFGAYSLSRRAPSASRSALRNSRSIITKQSRMGKREFLRRFYFPLYPTIDLQIWPVPPRSLPQKQAPSSILAPQFVQNFASPVDPHRPAHRIRNASRNEPFHHKVPSSISRRHLD